MTIQWSLVLFTVLAGLGGWCFAFVAVDRFMKKTPKAAFPAALVAGITAVVGGLCSVTHLGNPSRIFAALTHAGSGIFYEMLLIGVMLVCVVAFLVLLKRGQEGAATVLAVIGGIAGVVLSFACGASYMMAARPAWDTIALPLAYGGTALVLGAAAYALVAAATSAKATAGDEAATSVAGALGFYGIVVAICGIVAAVTVLVYGAAADLMADSLIWIAVLAAGIAPAALGFFASKRSNGITVLLGIACACALVGAVALRCAMWIAGTPIMDAFGIVL